MKLNELALQYRQSAAAVKARIAELKAEADKISSKTEALHMRMRIAQLVTIAREADATALYLERYYNRGYGSHGRYAV